ncbi:MAG: hypothetical protein DWQ47_02470 [Acidobacteria bacterium]|nr:MAG: hypothetical protein DWQ32_06020 [Acidobacteriota bacterium]REK01279.1 MAG: hypothetical protein DWQ38_02455 [Acidobacteriota bacterium]REK14235.1 MAG: hypothetical protein DWQ43_11710 [Acidobacteriota bacterium]REK44950.1 MAG: hypothetical protein DWQ47_02470 [Acidobacteriota bacterium]
MKNKSKIKVIRKKDVSAQKVKRQKTVEPDKNSARRVVTNVSSWVNELQKRKRAETKEALDKIFPANPQTDSA